MEDLNLKSTISQDFFTMKKEKKDNTHLNIELDVELNYE